MVFSLVFFSGVGGSRESALSIASFRLLSISSGKSFAFLAPSINLADLSLSCFAGDAVSLVSLRFADGLAIESSETVFSAEAVSVTRVAEVTEFS